MTPEDRRELTGLLLELLDPIYLKMQELQALAEAAQAPKPSEIDAALLAGSAMVGPSGIVGPTNAGTAEEEAEEEYLPPLRPATCVTCGAPRGQPHADTCPMWRGGPRPTPTLVERIPFACGGHRGSDATS
jgi:hypothetical protein